MKITVVQTGRLRDPHVAALRDEYVKRFGRFGKLEVVEREPKGDTPLWPTGARWRIALDERGEQYDSPVFAKRLERWSASHGPLAFLVGDSYGHHAPSLALADSTMSLGKMVLPHQLAHLVLVEQIYRAATIQAGTGYHHG
ncbi:MAG: 23S rRNA (pseudouridine(1915)-N(3))-methyltransferase RlmH [Planctomycetota bacterium]